MTFDLAREIKKTREELVRRRKLVSFFTSEYKLYKKKKSDLAPPYKLMARQAKLCIKPLETYLQKLKNIKRRLDR